MQARSQLLAAYPWSNATPSAETLNAADEARYDEAGGMLVFTRPDKPWGAIVGALPQPTSGAPGALFWGPVEEDERAGYSQQSFSSAGELRWDLDLASDAEQTIWIAIAGSNRSVNHATETLGTALTQANDLLRAKVAAREALLARARLTLPEPELLAAYSWGKLNMADLRRTVRDL